MRAAQRLLAVALLLLLAGSTTALADHLDPKKRIREADEVALARLTARRMTAAMKPR